MDRRLVREWVSNIRLYFRISRYDTPQSTLWLLVDTHKNDLQNWKKNKLTKG